MRHLRVAFVALAIGCGSSSGGGQLEEPTRPAPADETRPLPSCREAVHDESRLLVASLGETNAPQGLAIQLDGIAAELEVTWSVLESLRQLRTTAHGLVPATARPDLERAASTSDQACAALDVPEERARSALDGAIALLAEGKYEKMLETYIPPAHLRTMKETGEYDEALANFRDGYGQRLHDQLERVRGTEPELKPDGSVEFRSSGRESDKVVLENIGGRWFFRQ